MRREVGEWYDYIIPTIVCAVVFYALICGGWGTCF